MSQLPVISAIIPSKNRPAGLAALLDGLRRQDYPQDRMEIWVIDDGSTPPYPCSQAGVRLIRHERSQGAQAARNEGLRQARGDFILMLDDDIQFVNVDFITKAAAVLQKDDRVGAVFGRKYDVLDNSDSRRVREFSLARPTWYSGDMVGTEGTVGPVCWGNQVYLTRRDLLRQIGGYDGIYGLNGGHSFREESDVHARLRRLGYTLWYLPEISIRHQIVPHGGHGPATGKRLFWIAHNHMVFLRRHLAFWPLRALGYWFDIARYSWVQGRFRYAPAMIKGYFAGWRNALRDRGPGRNPWLKATS